MSYKLGKASLRGISLHDTSSQNLILDLSPKTRLEATKQTSLLPDVLPKPNFVRPMGV